MFADLFFHELAILLGVVTLFLWRITRRQPHIPPGPWPVWPIFGNIPALGLNPMKRFGEWRKRYGDLYSFYVGSRLVVMLNGYDVLHQALVKQGDEFAHKPRLHMFELIENGIATSNGQVWKEQRRFAFSTLRDFGIGKNIMEEKIKVEVIMFLKELEEQKGKKIEFSHLTHNALSNIMCSVLFGKRFEYNDKLFADILRSYDENFAAILSASVVSVFPFLKYLPLKIGDTFRTTLEHVDNTFLRPIIEQHIKDYDENNINDFIYAYIKEVKRREALHEGASFNYKTLFRVIGDLFVGGSETVATTIRWAVIYLIRSPEIQEKCFRVIKETIGLERFPSMSDMKNMPYMEAVIAEIQRLSDIFPFSVMRSAPYDLSLNGYTIPEGTIILPHLSSVHKDPKVFENPGVFKPERFLDSNGNVSKPAEFMPFTIGKRNCLGESLARMELFLFLTAMIQRFRFENPDDEELPSLEFKLGATATPKCFNFLAVRRLE